VRRRTAGACPAGLEPSDYRWPGGAQEDTVGQSDEPHPGGYFDLIQRGPRPDQGL
jgi:hypothetical protein